MTTYVVTRWYRAPEVILDMGFGGAEGVDEQREVAEHWARFSTLPAVRSGRVHALQSDVVVRPGPAMGEALETLRALLDQRAGGQ